MKKIKRTGFLMVIALAAVFLISACGKKATPESLLTDVNKNLEEVKSVSANFRAEMTIEEGGESVGLQVDLDMDTTDEPPAAYTKGTISLKQGSTSYGMDVEGYTVKEGDSYVSYACADNQWNREEIEDEEDILGKNVVEDFVKHHEDFKMSEDTVEVNGETCLEMKGEVRAEDMEALIGETFLESLESGLDEIEAEDDEKITCTIAVYKDKILPARIRIETEGIYVEVTYKEYNNVEEIQVPKEVLEETGGMSSDDEKGDKKDKEDEKSSKDNKLKKVQSSSLGDSWDSYTVQIEDQVITLPCEIADLEAAGLTLDTDMTPEDYIVNADRDELVYFRNSQGASIMVSLVNQTEEPKAVTECIVGSISVGGYTDLFGEINVVFPGGIQLGADMDTVKAVYGEADDEYKNDSYIYLTWYDPDIDKYNNMCYIDFDVETNEATDITLSCYE